ncbi:MAG: aspartate kinase [Deltaproteobacteria bacterium]|nr:MAG: aspartate kinase [Deltaproteobacteria bacterium]
MALIVQKYGGTSVANLDRIRNVAHRVIRTREAGHDVVVVVSAMAGETDRLLNLAHQAAESPSEREVDVILATGEQVTSALLAIVLQDMGYKAKSYLGHQVKIVTDSVHGRARIQSVDSYRLLGDLREGIIPVVAGFQGEAEGGDITTLGRGGSDTTAVALAAALGADVCEIYTDVDGVYTTDPNIYDKARKLRRISYEEMLEMASLGAKVLQIRAVEFAAKYKVPLHVRSSFSDEEGTIVCEEDEEMEKAVVSGVTYDRNQSRIELIKVPDRPGVAAKLFQALSHASIPIDMIIQTSSSEGQYANLAFTVSKTDYPKALEIAREVARELGAQDVLSEEEVAKVSIVGIGMRSHTGVASKMFQTLANEGINIKMISTSEIKISCIIEPKYTELAVRALHDAFGLERGEG